MLIHVRHSHPRELSPDRLMFNFDVPSLMKRLRRRTTLFRRGPTEGEAEIPAHDPARIHVTPGDRLFAQLAPQRGDAFSIELPAPARSEVIIVISPLRSLIRDRRTALKIHSPRGVKPLFIDFTVLRLGKIRLLYITPESMISRSLREDLNTLIEGFWPTTLIMDQAHRLSEWSGEFDPAFLRLPRVITDLRQLNPALSALALTAESGDRVRGDILSILDGFKDMTPSIRADFYRPRVSFQAVTVGSFEEKKTAYRNLLSRVIPEVLGREGIFNQAAEDLPPYEDPYAALPGSAEASDEETEAKPRPPAIITYPTLSGPEKPHLLLQTTLAGNRETWLCQAVRTGIDDNRVHCLHLIDLPTADCEVDMRRRRSRVPECVDSVCAFGRDTLCDYGKQHHLIQRRYPDAPALTLQALRVLDRLLDSRAAGHNPLRIICDDLEPKRVAEALHRFSVLGMVEIFFIDFREGEAVFKVYGFVEAMNPEAAAVGLFRYLQKNDLSTGKRYASRTPEGVPDVTAEIARFQGRYADRLREWLLAASEEGGITHYKSHPDYFHGIIDYLPVMADQVPGAMRKMAYRRLRNLKDFLHRPRCRYAELMMAVRATDEDWGCGFCDRCVPNLDFGAAEHAAPSENLPLEALETGFRQWLDSDAVGFESDAADRFIRDFGDAYHNLLIRSRRSLEYAPHNLKALYVARELADASEAGTEALDLMAVALRDLPQLQSIRFYETFRGEPEVRRALFDLMDDTRGPLNRPDGERWLYRKALELDLEESRSDLFAAREMLNILHRTDFSTHRTKLAQLVEEF